MISKVSSKNKEKHCKKKNSVKKTTIRQKKKKTIQRNRKQRHRESNPVYLHALRASNSSTQTRRFSVCAVIYRKDLVSLRCIKGRKEEKREATGG